MGYLSALIRWGTTFFVRVEHPFLNESLQWTYPIATSVVTVRSRFAGALLLGECGQCFPFGADGGVVAVPVRTTVVSGKVSRRSRMEARMVR